MYNGSFRCECYHRIFCFNQDGKVQAGLLRHGNVAGSHDWPLVLVAVIDGYRALDIAKSFRADGAVGRCRASFGSPPVAAGSGRKQNDRLAVDGSHGPKANHC